MDKVTLELDVFKYSETVSIECTIDTEKHIIIPDSDDYNQLLADFIGQNVIILSNPRGVNVLGMDNGELKLITNDGALDYPNTLDSLVDEYFEKGENNEEN